MKYDSQLISKPYAQPRLQRTAWGFVTLGFWALYFYLWSPLATLVLWLLGIRTAFFELYTRQHQVEPFLLISLPIIAVLCALLLIGWAEYNRHRFGKSDRRGAQANVSLEEVAAGLGAAPAVAASLRDAKVTVLHMDDRAQPSAMTPSALAMA
ncbi:poly-beta-1,6-N-acetyl-D-glucosamine biosynthesis protein PgaD [Pseudoxanthomonas wuyuanensis]|uniref:Biofilm PGA synthesis protein PgaD n=1 Tax=Pseudoxanthomonas wuyuanensis TaxID=1073196 RepID=A0A286CW92_9GAMM|nr:poly-beta-1,6-N-acetyl-D-glucosamine biosynthesis protein PgaD [Pseudoxanthomonas wuyuanensis]KAF1719176.1 poly-beta-1,6-N-acetyl-D-glucosamine biosynthesis protein PgaD [Pseudoxanthomonas wuyuanensis]SOD50655.1 biofilm PGA synthesis protein PgaD [Pseudoxanthomonas wuyuanensis]